MCAVAIIKYMYTKEEKQVQENSKKYYKPDEKQRGEKEKILRIIIQ